MNKLPRTIKFRVWDESKKVFLDSCQGDYEYTVEGMIGSKLSCVRRFLGEYDGALINCVIQQFTGLKDKNGKDIYEGDKVEVSYKMDDNGDLERQRSEVVFENGAFGDKWDHFSNYSMLPNFTVEVVGNVFENVI